MLYFISIKTACLALTYDKNEECKSSVIGSGEEQLM
jgi:hypothetical protein